jgi:hypothetical protein
MECPVIGLPNTGISCEAVPASTPSTGAGMRRHVHLGNHAAESFVSFIPLFDAVVISLGVLPASDLAGRGADQPPLGSGSRAQSADRSLSDDGTSSFRVR